MRILLAGLFLAALSGTAGAQDFSGTYAGDTDGAAITVELQQHNDGTVSGTLSGEGTTARLSGRIVSGRLVGTGHFEDEPFEFSGDLRGDVLSLSDGHVVHALHRVGAPAGAAAKRPVESSGHGAAEPKAPPATPGPPGFQPAPQAVTVNGVRLSAAQISSLEQNFRVRVQPGDFWYDGIWGVWGFKGGPIRGFLPAGLNLGGRLQADASGATGTGVFVNGRELHALDVLALRQLGPVYAGRFWIDAQGYYGFEGGPPVGNFRAALQQPQQGGRRESVLSSWDRTGVAVYDLR